MQELLTLLCTVGPIEQCHSCTTVQLRQKAHLSHRICQLGCRCRFRRARQLVWQVLRSCVGSLKMRNARGDDCTAEFIRCLCMQNITPTVIALCMQHRCTSLHACSTTSTQQYTSHQNCASFVHSHGPGAKVFGTSIFLLSRCDQLSWCTQTWRGGQWGLVCMTPTMATCVVTMRLFHP